MNGPRSEEISQNFPLDEEFEENEIMQSVVQHDSDDHGDNGCNVIFDCNSGDDAKLTGDEGSGEENLQILKNFFEGVIAVLLAFRTPVVGSTVALGIATPFAGWKWRGDSGCHWNPSI